MGNFNLKKFIYKVGDWINTTNSWFAGGFSNKYKEVWVDLDNTDYGIEATSGVYINDLMPQILKKICEEYPNYTGTIFKGAATPSSRAYFEVLIYDTSIVDSTTGLPQYAFGKCKQYQNVEYSFYVYNYAFISQKPFLTKAYTSDKVTQNANSGGAIDISVSIPSGYTLIGIISVNLARNVGGSIGGFYLNGSTVKIYCTNRTSSKWTDQTATVTCLFAPSGIRDTF